jgi:hypothetical protein
MILSEYVHTVVVQRLGVSLKLIKFYSLSDRV